MKIVIIHYRFFETGGPERYLFNIMKMLSTDGHTVIPFSIKHKNNLQTEYKDYFLSPIGKGDVTYANEVSPFKISDVFKTVLRQFFSLEAYFKLSRLIKNTKPDLIYVL